MQWILLLLIILSSLTTSYFWFPLSGILGLCPTCRRWFERNLVTFSDFPDFSWNPTSVSGPRALAAGQEIDRVQNGRLGNILLWPKVELPDALNNLGHQLRRGQIGGLHRACGDFAARFNGNPK